VRPRRFFRVGVAPGDQAPGLVFAVVVALAYVGGLFAFVPATIPDAGGGGPLSVLLGLLAVALLIAPAALHLTAALQTVLLIVLVRDRAGISETVQVLAYAAAPCALAGVPIPGVRVVCALYGAALLAVGISEVHETNLARAALATALPSALVFGYGFRGFAAAMALLREWAIV
jgi:hypothetical protein